MRQKFYQKNCIFNNKNELISELKRIWDELGHEKIKTIIIDNSKTLFEKVIKQNGNYSKNLKIKRNSNNL